MQGHMHGCTCACMHTRVLTCMHRPGVDVRCFQGLSLKLWLAILPRLAGQHPLGFTCLCPTLLCLQVGAVNAHLLSSDVAAG